MSVLIAQPLYNTSHFPWYCWLSWSCVSEFSLMGCKIPKMSATTPLPPLLPATGERWVNHLATSPHLKRTNVSVACIECRNKKVKVWKSSRFLECGAYFFSNGQCSGKMPCTWCTEKGCRCLVDPRADRRRRSHLHELSKLHDTLHTTVNKLRCGTPDEVKSLVLAIRSFETDQSAVEYLLRGVFKDYRRGQ